MGLNIDETRLLFSVNQLQEAENSYMETSYLASNWVGAIDSIFKREMFLRSSGASTRASRSAMVEFVSCTDSMLLLLSSLSLSGS